LLLISNEQVVIFAKLFLHCSETMLLFGTEFFVFQFAIQKVKDLDI